MHTRTCAGAGEGPFRAPRRPPARAVSTAAQGELQRPRRRDQGRPPAPPPAGPSLRGLRWRRGAPGRRPGAARLWRRRRCRCRREGRRAARGDPRYGGGFANVHYICSYWKLLKRYRVLLNCVWSLRCFSCHMCVHHELIIHDGMSTKSIDRTRSLRGPGRRPCCSSPSWNGACGASSRGCTIALNTSLSQTPGPTFMRLHEFIDSARLPLNRRRIQKLHLELADRERALGDLNQALRAERAERARNVEDLLDKMEGMHRQHQAMELRCAELQEMADHDRALRLQSTADVSSTHKTSKRSLNQITRNRKLIPCPWVHHHPPTRPLMAACMHACTGRARASAARGCAAG